MAKHIVKDHKKELKKYFKMCLDKWPEFKPLKRLHFLFLWKLNEPRFDEEGGFVVAQTRKLPVRERDVYGKDVEIEFCRQLWQDMNPKKRLRVMYHELKHICPELDENFNWIIDDDGRLKFKLIKHDIVVKTFKDEVDEFGLMSNDVPAATILAEALRKKEEKRKLKDAK